MHPVGIAFTVATAAVVGLCLHRRYSFLLPFALILAASRAVNILVYAQLSDLSLALRVGADVAGIFACYLLLRRRFSFEGLVVTFVYGVMLEVYFVYAMIRPSMWHAAWTFYQYAINSLFALQLAALAAPGIRDLIRGGVRHLHRYLRGGSSAAAHSRVHPRGEEAKGSVDA